MTEEVIEKTETVVETKPEAKPEIIVTETKPEPEKIEVQAQKWPDAWREEMAGTLAETATEEEKAEHDKTLKRLKRFNSPSDAAKALREQDKLISSGTLKKALPKNATETQVAEWRKENNIPEAPDKYDLGLSADFEVNDLDKEFLDGWASRAHKLNAPPELMKEVGPMYMEFRAKVAEVLAQKNVAAKKEVEDTLRQEWGQEYRTNLDGINSLLGNSDSKAVSDLLSARTEDGIQLLNNPEVVKWLAGHARELGFVGATVVPSGGDLGKGIDAEIEDLKKQMGTDEWAKNTKGQARFMSLVDAKRRIDARK